ncbi:hypothetical protein [Paenibacillus sp. HJGM_3]|uniref:hypothetical protein n=1 Tax=Paenibacillus sp. HJGM_3 TaxID=3379816 RepID=UPI00385DAEB8
MAFIPYSSDSKIEEPMITVDKMGRLCLNAALRRMLDCVNKEIELYVFFDAEARRIGIARNYAQGNLARVKPFKFDQHRGYAMAQNFLEHHDILYKDGAVRYEFDKMVGDVMAFNAARNGVRTITTFRGEKNGNLERLPSEQAK